MWRSAWVVVVSLFSLLGAVDAAQADKRIALLIGNQAYTSEIGRLANPHNDIALLEKALKGLQFEVISVRDATLGGMHQAVNAHLRRVKSAGPGTIAFLYYAGHGASDTGGTNYLIPVDVKSAEEGELWDVSLRLAEITRRLKTEAGNATHFVVFDACRNTLRLVAPGTRALVQSRGFAAVPHESGMLVAYATAEGALASDIGAGAGPYASVLADEIVRPGVEAVTMFRNVQRRVLAAIKQEPYLTFSALGDVYLAGLAADAKTGPPPSAPPSARQSEAAEAWAATKDTQSTAALEAFIRRFGDTYFGELARMRLSELKQAEAVKQAAADRKKGDDEAHAKAEAAQVCVNVEGILNVPVLKNMGNRHKGTPAGACIAARIDLLQKQQVAVAPPPTAPAFDLPASNTPSCGTMYSEADCSGVGTLGGGPCEWVPPAITEHGTRRPGYCRNSAERPPVRAGKPLTAVEERALKPGDSFKECHECPEMVVVPAGSFFMGSPLGEDGREENEGPRRTVRFARPFAVGKFELTFAEWDACHGAGGCNHTPDDRGWGRGKRPVINVSWDDITKEYLPWLSLNTGKQYRLPTEAEWEYAARAGSVTRYSFGNTIVRSQAQFSEQFPSSAGKTVEVGSFQPNAFGLYDLHGNVTEWVEDCWHANYHGAPTDGSAWTSGCILQATARQYRGGSWSDAPPHLRSARRLAILPEHRNTTHGFRVARTLAP